MRPFLAQLTAEVQMTLKRGETLLLTLGIPLILLIFFSQIKITSSEGAHPVDLVTPGIIALAVMSTSMVSLGIATGFERSYGVLKRLGTTPLGRGRLLAAKIAGVFAVEVLQVLVIVLVGLALGWKPTGGVLGGLEAAAACIAGSIAFGGIGLALAGRLRAEVNLAAANGLYLILLLLGGMVVPLSVLPEGIRFVAEVLPAAALASAIHGAIGPGAGYSWDWATLLIWMIIAPVVAATTFRFTGDGGSASVACSVERGHALAEQRSRGRTEVDLGDDPLRVHEDRLGDGREPEGTARHGERRVEANGEGHVILRHEGLQGALRA